MNYIFGYVVGLLQAVLSLIGFVQQHPELPPAQQQQAQYVAQQAITQATKTLANQNTPQTPKVPEAAPFSLALPSGMSFDRYPSPLVSKHYMNPADSTYTILKTMHTQDSATGVQSFLSIAANETVKKEACILNPNSSRVVTLDGIDAQRFETTMTCAGPACDGNGTVYGFDESVWAVYAGNTCYQIHIVVSPEDSKKDGNAVRQVRDDRYASLVKAVEFIRFSQ